MKRLSALDALFLYMETPETPMHVASVTIFEPGQPGEDLFQRFRAHTASRLDLLPSYRRRLEWTPLGMDHPVWVDDEKIDLDYHIRHAALPKPGGMAELRALVAQLHAVPLDRARPLWEYTFIEGLEGGRFAVYVKVHHSAMDGIAGMATLGVIYDFEPGPPGEKLPRTLVPPDREPEEFDRAREHRDRRLRPPGLAGGEGAALGRAHADQGRPQSRAATRSFSTATSRTCRGRRSTPRSPATASMRRPRCLSTRSRRWRAPTPSRSTTSCWR